MKNQIQGTAPTNIPATCRAPQPTFHAASFAAAFSVALLIAGAFDVAAKPRPPLPPLPELAPLLFHTSFDEPFWARTEKLASFHPAYTDLVESWSGYALRRAGKAVTPFIVPALDQSGHTNVNCSDGAIRFWFVSGKRAASFRSRES